MSELELISKQLSEISDKLNTMEDKLNVVNTNFQTHLAHYEECKSQCHLHRKVLFGNGDGEKGLQYKVIELVKWKGLQRKIFWTILIPILMANAGLFAKFVLSSENKVPSAQASTAKE